MRAVILKWIYLLLMVVPTSGLAVWWESDWDVALRTAYVYPSANLVHEIYTEDRWDIELDIDKHICDAWSVWSNISYMNLKGHSTGLGESTNLRMVPWSIGAKYTLPIDTCLNFYFGLGISCTWIHLVNDSPFVVSPVDKTRIGFTTKTGLQGSFTECFFWDAFVDYLYIPVSMTNVNRIGGIRLGVGLGWR